MHRSVCGGILVLALLAGSAASAVAQETGTPIFKAPYRAFESHEFGASLSDPGDGIELRPRGLLPVREGTERLQRPGRLRRCRWKRHHLPHRWRLPDPGGELQRELPAGRGADPRVRRPLRRGRRRLPPPRRHLARSAVRRRRARPPRSCRTSIRTSCRPSAAAMTTSVRARPRRGHPLQRAVGGPGQRWTRRHRGRGRQHRLHALAVQQFERPAADLRGRALVRSGSESVDILRSPRVACGAFRGAS